MVSVLVIARESAYTASSWCPADSSGCRDPDCHGEGGPGLGGARCSDLGNAPAT